MFRYSCMRLIQNILIIFCTILVINGIINGSALAADRNVIIGFHQSDAPSEEKLVHDNGGKVKKTFHLISAVSANMSDANITKLEKDPRVAYIENDTIYRAADEYTSSWGVQHIGTQVVHNQNINGTGVKIAVLDTGIDFNHPDLKDNFIVGVSFAQDTSGNIINPDGLDDSSDSHGTHVSGVIAAEKNNIGVVGVAPNASIYAVKVLDGAGSGMASWIIAGIEWAVTNKMNIVTMSITCTPNPVFPDECDSIALRDTVNKAYSAGLLLVAAGGNTNGGIVTYPAAYDSVIAVSATDANDQIAGFSAIGPKIELAAPGVDIYSTVQGGGYAFLSGTSMAAPHVTGVAALIYSSNFTDVNGDGKKNNIDVRELLHKAKDLGIAGIDDKFGYGLVDAQMSVLRTSAPPIPPLPPKIINSSPTSPVNDIAGASRTFNVTIDQIVNVTWYINGTLVGSINGVTNAKYTNSSASSGIWNVTAVASNVNGSVMRSWTWNVTPVPPPVSTINLILKIIYGSPKDTQKVNLQPGKYSINIRNINLKEVDMKVYQNGVLQKRLSRDFEFDSKRKDIYFDLTVKKFTVITFIPYGKRGSTGYVTIRRLLK